MPGGRQKSWEWKEVHEIKNSSKVLCKYCSSKLSNKIGRIRNHLSKCRSRNESVGNFQIEILDNDFHSTSPSPINSNKRRCQEIVSAVESIPNTSSIAYMPGRRSPTAGTVKPAKISKLPCSEIKVLTTKLTEAERNALDMQVARFFYGNNINFHVVDSKSSAAMFTALRPGYEAPNASKLANPLLDTIAKEMNEKLADNFKDASFTLLLDGFSNTRNDPLMLCSVSTGTCSYLLNASDSSFQKKTTEYCAKIAENEILNIRNIYNEDVFAICLDNENKIRQLQEQLNLQFPDLLIYGCSAHHLNLVKKDVLPRTIYKDIVEVQEYFLNNNDASGWLNLKDGLMPQLPDDAIWNSQEDCIRTFVDNCHIYDEIKIQHADKFDQQIANILGNYEIHTQAVHLKEQLQIFSKSIDKLRSKDATLSIAVEVWFDLLECSELELFREELDNQFRQIIDPVYFLCNVMDPRFKGHRLTSKHEEDAEQWLAERKPTFLPFFLAFKIEDPDLFPKIMFSPAVVNQFSAAKWWKLMESRTVKSQKLPADFCSFFWKLNCCPPVSTASEELFSIYGSMWRTHRNVLGVDETTKLLNVYKNLHDESSSPDD